MVLDTDDPNVSFNNFMDIVAPVQQGGMVT